MKKERLLKFAPFTFRDAYLQERKDFGQTKPYTQTFKSKKDYNRKVMKQMDRKKFMQES